MCEIMVSFQDETERSFGNASDNGTTPQYSNAVLNETHSFILSTSRALSVIAGRNIEPPKINMVALEDDQEDARYDPKSKTLIINLNALFRDEEDKSTFNPDLKIAVVHELIHHTTGILHKNNFDWRNVEENESGPEILPRYIIDEGSRCEFVAGILSGTISTKKGLRKLIEDVSELGYNEQTKEIFVDLFRILKRGGNVSKNLHDYIRSREKELGDHLYIYGMVISSIMLIGNGLERNPEEAVRKTINDLLVTPLEDIIYKASGIVIDGGVNNAYRIIRREVLKGLEEERKMRDNETQKERAERMERMEALQALRKAKRTKERLRDPYNTANAISMLEKGTLKAAFRQGVGNTKGRLKR